MANISGDVQIETRIKHDLPIAFQSVVGEQSINVGTLVSGDVNQVAFARSFRAIRLLFYRDAENLMNSASWLCMCGDLRRYCFLAGLFLEAFQG